MAVIIALFLPINGTGEHEVRPSWFTAMPNVGEHKVRPLRNERIMAWPWP